MQRHDQAELTALNELRPLGFDLYVTQEQVI